MANCDLLYLNTLYNIKTCRYTKIKNSNRGTFDRSTLKSSAIDLLAAHVVIFIYLGIVPSIRRG